MQLQVSDKPAFTFVGVRIRTRPKSEKIAQLWAQHGERLGSVPKTKQNGACGVMEMVDEEAGILEYMAAVAVTEADEIPEGMSRWDVPAATYAVFEATLPTLAETFEKIYGEWLPKSDFERGDGPDIEHYGPDFNPHDPTAKLSVYIPVQQRK